MAKSRSRKGSGGSHLSRRERENQRRRPGVLSQEQREALACARSEQSLEEAALLLQQSHYEGALEALCKVVEGTASTVVRPLENSGWECVASYGICGELPGGASDFVNSEMPESILGSGKPGTTMCRGLPVSNGRGKDNWALWVPAIRRGLLLGLLVFLRPGDHPFTIKEEQAGVFAAAHLAKALKRKRKAYCLPLAVDDLQTAELTRILADGDVRTQFQPIISLWSGGVAGYEALTRGPVDSSLMDIHNLFRQAKGGLARKLDLLCIAKAVERLREADSNLVSGRLLFFNIRPESAGARELREVFWQARDRLVPWNIVLEIIEEPATDTDLLLDLRDLIRSGFNIAADDHGVGWSNTFRLQQLRPRFIKIPYEIARSICDPGIQEVVKGVVQFAEHNGATVIAEGVEEANQVQAFLNIGVGFAQGYCLGKPSTDLASGPVPRNDDVRSLLEELARAERGSRRTT